jgi:filamentous hemagglutinin family protein
MKIKLLAVHIGLILSSSALAEGIATDGSMGTAQTFNGKNVTIPQTSGSTVGNNLFHSFSDFNINTGQTVTFTGADNLQNVISRVTGNDKSIIDGTLKSDIKNADFYFINPNGITFNANASVDVPAAFHVTTADKMDFGKNGGVFYADLSKKSLLSSESPAALGFLGTSKANNGLIGIDSSQLRFKNEQIMDMVAGEITVENNAILSLKNAEARLVAIKNEGSVDLEKTKNDMLSLPNAIPLANNAGKITLNNSQITTTANGQHIGIWGGDIVLTNTWIVARNDGETNAIFGKKDIEIFANSLNASNQSSIWTDNTPDSSGDAGNVFVTITQSAMFSDSSSIESDSYGSGDAGTINITANHIELDSKAKILSSTQGDSKGNTGFVTVNATTLTMNDDTSIYSSTPSEGYTGNVIVKADSINMDKNAWIYSMSKGTGKTGDVVVESTNLLNMTNGASISNNTLGLNNGGNVTVKAGDIRIDNNANIISFYAGDVTVDSMNSLKIENGAGIGQFVNHEINMANPNNNSQATGNVIVNAGSIVLDGKGTTQTGIYSTTAQGGNISVKSQNSLEIINGASISTAPDLGDAGDIKVKAASLIIDNQTNNKGITGIYSDNYNAGRTGSISLEIDGALNILNGGEIYNSTFNESDAGDVTVKAGSLKIEGSDNQDNSLTGIYSETLSGGKGGNVYVESQGNLSILHGGVIDTSTFPYSTGKAGDVTVITKTLQIDGLRQRLNFPEPSGIYSKAAFFSSGQTGNVHVMATDSIYLSNLGKISIENYGSSIDTAQIIPSTIKVNAPNINMDIFSQITSQSIGNITAGNIAVNFINRLNMNLSFINTTANTGDGGSIKINGGELIFLKNAGFGTTVNGENGNGGDISVKTSVLVMDTGLIQANAVSGNGGNINLALQTLIPSANQLLKGGESVDWNKSPSNLIQAASQSGVSGTVNNSAPQMNLSGVLVNINSNNFDTRPINQDYCKVEKGSSLSKKGKGGLPLRAKDLQVY